MLARKFRTVVDKTSTEDDIGDLPETHVVNVTYPPTPTSNITLDAISKYKSFVHDFRVECGDKSVSVYEIFTAIFPIGCTLQSMTVRYDTDQPERATIGMGQLSDSMESVHIISPSISENDVSASTTIVGEKKDFSVRLTGLISNNLRNKDDSIEKRDFVKYGNDYIVFSKSIIHDDFNFDTILEEEDTLRHIFGAGTAETRR